MGVNIKNVFSKIGDAVKSIPKPPPLPPLKPLPPLPPLKPLPPLPKLKPLPPLKPLGKPKGIKGPLDKVNDWWSDTKQKISDYWASLKAKFMMAIYITAGVIGLGIIIKFWPIFSFIFSTLWYFFKMILGLFVRRDQGFSSI